MHLVLIDDHPLFSEGLKSVLEQEDDIEKVKIFDGEHLDIIHRYIYNNEPDLILLDIRLGGVTRMICSGTSNTAIADKFGITERAIDYRIQQIKKKLNVSSTQEAIVKEVKFGWVQMHS